MFKLRHTWTDIFPEKKLYSIDLGCHSIDPAWPVAAKPPTAPTPSVPASGNSIHVNPKFLKQKVESPRKMWTFFLLGASAESRSSNRDCQIFSDCHTFYSLENLNFIALERIFMWLKDGCKLFCYACGFLDLSVLFWFSLGSGGSRLFSVTGDADEERSSSQIRFHDVEANV